jgi:hypothetical protein
MDVRVYSVFVLSCSGSGLATELIPRPRGLTDWSEVAFDWHCGYESKRLSSYLNLALTSALPLWIRSAAFLWSSLEI